MALLMVAGCADGDAPRNLPQAEGEIEVTLTLPIASQTRALPAGGEDGDGRETGLDAENEVFDANLFFFAGTSFNADAGTPVSCVYIDDLQSPALIETLPLEKRIKIKVKISETNLSDEILDASSTVSFLAVVNAGRDLSSITTLGELRSSETLPAVTPEEHFVMTTAYDSPAAAIRGSNRLAAHTPGPGEDPNVRWTGETTVQRLAARIDVAYSSQSNQPQGAQGLLYDVECSGGKIHLTNILPVNIAAKPSYLLTKTTKSLPTDWSSETGLGDIVWGGAQSIAAGAPSNYVIDPRTLLRVAAAAPQNDWYLNPASSAINDIKDTSKGNLSAYCGISLTPESGFNYDNALIMGYSNENVQSPLSYNSEFMTGIIIRALYQPAKWTAADGSQTDAAGWTPTTFWRYLPIAVGEESCSDEHALYFNDEDALTQYMFSRPNENRQVQVFEGGVCYYNLWLRHYNPTGSGNELSAPMQYAIVRNNIYRVAFEFTGPGEPEPTLREPYTMKSHIFVRPWNLREERNPMTF